MALGFNKINFWPRPKDQNHDVLIRTVTQLDEINYISAVAEFNGKLYIAGQQLPTASTNVPTLYEWDEAQDTLTAIAMPAAIQAVGGLTQITGMIAYANRLWIVTGGSANAADNGLFYGLDRGGNWATAAATIAWPGWTGGVVALMYPRLSLLGTSLVAASDTVGVTEVNLYDGTAWTNEPILAFGAAITTPRPIATATGELYLGLGTRVVQRSAAGVYSTALILDGGAGRVSGGLATFNRGQVWAAQSFGGAVTNPPQLAQVAPTQKIRALRTGITAMLPLAAGQDVTRETDDVVLAATADPGSGVLAAGGYPAYPITQIVIMEDGLSVRPLVATRGTVHFIIKHGRYVYVGHAAMDPFNAAVPALPADDAFVAQLSVLE